MAWFIKSLMLMITLALTVAACSGGERATSAPAGLRVEQVLERSAQAMAGVSTFRFSLENTGGDTPIPGGLGLRSATGVMAKPDRLSAQVKAMALGFLVEVKVVSVGGKTYMTNPLGSGWQTYDSAVSPVAFLDPAKGVALILQSMQSPVLEGEGQGAAYRVRGRLPAQTAQFVAGSFAEGAVVDAMLLIGKDDLRLLQATLSGRITKDEPLGIVRTLVFSEFNAPVAIEPPV
jgi:hypothetical protein